MEIYSTAYLMGLVASMKRVPNFFLSTFFNSVELFDTEKVFFDMITENPLVAPFVSPLSAGKPMQTGGYSTKSFSPAYIKPILPVRPTDTVDRMAGEGLLGEMTKEQRLTAIVAQKVETILRMFNRRLEVMASEAIVYGRQTVIGEGFNAVVSFGRDSSLVFALGGANKWDNVTSGVYDAPIADQLETWSALIDGFNGGYEMLIMDADAWNLFRKNKYVLEELDSQNKGSSSSIITSPEAMADGVPQFKGRLGGFEIWVYNATYRDPVDNTLKKLIPTKTAVLTGRAIEGVRAFGAVMDLDKLVPVEIYTDSFDTKEPSMRYIRGQSAPLMVPKRVNSAVVVTVA
jgi:hypothetical protein